MQRVIGGTVYCPSEDNLLPIHYYKKSAKSKPMFKLDCADHCHLNLQ